MAEKTKIGGTGEVFQGEDKIFQMTVQDTSDVAVNITGWVIVFDVRRSDADTTALFTKTCVATDAVNGVTAATVADTDMDLILGKTGGKIYRYSFKRTDAGLETVLAWGDFVVQKATAD